MPEQSQHQRRQRSLRNRLAALLFGLPMAAAAVDGEAALKAAFLYNFALYTNWPELGATFEICAIGKEPLGEALDALSRKEIAGRPVRVRRLAVDEVPADCNIVFVPASESERLAKLLAPLASKPVLTVAEASLGGPARPMLHLASEQGRLLFDAHRTTARAAGLDFSSKLLRLARSVD